MTPTAKDHGEKNHNKHGEALFPRRRDERTISTLRNIPKPLPASLNKLSRDVMDAAYKVHSCFGPGLLEGVYEAFLVHELRKRGHEVRRQVPIHLEMDGFKLEGGLRLDILVEDELILELKAVDSLEAIHTAQLLTYLKLSKKRLGLLINFNVEHLKQGIRRVAL